MYNIVEARSRGGNRLALSCHVLLGRARSRGGDRLGQPLRGMLLLGRAHVTVQGGVTVGRCESHSLPRQWISLGRRCQSSPDWLGIRDLAIHKGVLAWRSVRIPTGLWATSVW